MTLISGSAALSAFRQTLTGQYGLDLLEGAEGKLLVQLPIGVGKSRWLDAITLAALEQYPLVVILAPTRQLIGERRPLANPPENIRVVNLRPRPSERCGPERESAWRRFESRDLGALGRAEICGRCPLRQGCFWPDQFGASLEGARLIYATQAHIVRSPGFIPMLRQMSGAKTLLTLFDEAYFLDASPEEVIDRFDLLRFRAALRDARFIDPDLEALNRRWLDLVETLLGARTSDLTSGRWDFPSIRSDWALRVQEAGISLSGDSFRFLGFTLARFGASPAETRRRNARGDIEFADRPTVGDCIVFSGTAAPEFVKLRLGAEVSTPFADHRFRHPDTRFFNLASSIGTARHFVRHSDQILDFFAELTTRWIAEGKRVLLISKKRFISECSSG